MDEGQKHEIATKRAEDKIAFFIHAAIYVAVNLLLMTNNLATNTRVLWFIWPLLGWGIGLAGHAALVFTSVAGGGFKEWMTRHEMKKLD